MPNYQFRCACGEFHLVRPMAASSDPAECPRCGGPARRVFGAPALRGGDPGLRRALDASARSADSPTVVSSPPPHDRRRRGTPVTT
ncbi:MAG: zinc ribbon domain-containing protein, partial [Pseudonocardia sp.]|nr:zinc ribbon domain-containing protein [Pseudonocardia sp.]